MYLELAKDSTQMRTARGGQGVVSWLGCAEDPRPERPGLCSIVFALFNSPPPMADSQERC